MFPFEQKNSKPRRTPEELKDVIHGAVHDRPDEINKSIEKIIEVFAYMNREEASRIKRVEQIAANHDHLLRNSVDLEEQKTNLDNLETLVAMAGGNEHAEAVVAAQKTAMMYEEIRREELTQVSRQDTPGQSQSKLDEVVDKNTTDSDDNNEAQILMLKTAKDRINEIYGEAA